MNPFAKETHLKEAEEYIRAHLSEIPGTAVVLGSGLGNFADTLEPLVIMKNQDIPHFPQPTVVGHEGKIIFGKIKSTTLLAIQGRSHFYEGKSFAEITFYVQLLKQLGVKNLILTNAAGGMNPALKPGDLVLLNDFINFTQINVLPNDQMPVTFFSQHLSKIAKQTAQKAGLKLHEGSYCWTTGPSYETHAEVRIIHEIGADVVGMSTVPELIMGAHLGLNILGISLVTNLAAGISAAPLTHEEVQTVADKIKKPYANYMSNLIIAIANSET